MKLILATKKKITEKQLAEILQGNGHNIEATCRRTEILLDYVRLIGPDMIIMEFGLPGKFKTCEVTQYLNEVIDTPVVYLIDNSQNMRRALELNPFGLITDPGDLRQIDYTLELVYNKFSESLYLL